MGFMKIAPGHEVEESVQEDNDQDQRPDCPGEDAEVGWGVQSLLA